MATDRLRALQDFLRDNPDDPFLWFAIAKEYEGIGQLDQAVSYYTELRRRYPDYVGLYFHLGKCYILKGQPELAVAVWRGGKNPAQQAGCRPGLAELTSVLSEFSDDDEDF